MAIQVLTEWSASLSTEAQTEAETSAPLPLKPGSWSQVKCRLVSLIVTMIKVANIYEVLVSARCSAKHFLDICFSF